MTGHLVLVATPIGNLGELSPRAVETLRGAAAICCEDTRRTGRLLAHAGVEPRPRLLRADDHTEQSVTAEALALLDRGATVAVVTDAGTPGIADPGARLVRAALEAGHEVSTVAGPSAAIAALVVSGLPTARFVFEGFLPRSGHDRHERLAELAGERRTIVVYEAPQRLARTLADLAEALGPGRRVAVARELTKLHEEVWRGSLGDAAARAAAAPTAPLGEHVVVVEGAPPPGPAGEAEVLDALAAAIRAGSTRSAAAAAVARATGRPRREVYDLAGRMPPPAAPHADG